MVVILRAAFLLLLLGALAHASDIPRPVLDTAYDWRCLGPRGIASTYVRQDTDLWHCQTNAAVNPDVPYDIQGRIYRVLMPVTVPFCPDQPAAESRTAACPIGQNGRWQQTRAYTSMPPPACWSPEAWQPVNPPADACASPAPALPLAATTSPVLSISPGNRYLRRDGHPFYYVADTGWLMSWQLTTAQTTHYLEDRASKGVKAIQGPIIGTSFVLPPYDGGADDPFIDSVPMRLNESWWVTTDHAVKEAARLGMTIAIAPVWGSDNDRIFVDPARHVEFVSLLARRYSNQAHVLWIAAGEYDKITDDVYVTNNRALNAAELARYNAITTALRANAHPQSLIVYHPDGWHQPSIDFGLDARVHFNMLQSSSNLHENIRRVPIERASTLTRPVIEAETGYESATNNPWRQRVPAYHTLMQGGAGYAYGHGLIWDFEAGWQTAMQAEGGVDVLTHYRTFAESIHAESNTPAQELVLTPGDISDGSNSYATALRSGDRYKLYSFVSNGRTFNLNTSTMAAGNLSARWYDPRNGLYSAPFPVARSTNVTLDPPGNEAQGNDWALVIETTPAVITGICAADGGGAR